MRLQYSWFSMLLLSLGNCKRTEGEGSDVAEKKQNGISVKKSWPFSEEFEHRNDILHFVGIFNEKAVFKVCFSGNPGNSLGKSLGEIHCGHEAQKRIGGFWANPVAQVSNSPRFTRFPSYIL